MPKSSGFNRTIKILIAFTDIVLYHISFIISFLIRYGGERPSFNFAAYQSSFPYIMLMFLFINTFSGLYILYNKKHIDMVSTTLISQILMSVLIMAMTFIGRWFAFPRTIVLISLITSTVLLIAWRLIVLEVYIKNTGTSKVMILGNYENVKEAVNNFKTSGTRQYQVKVVAFNNYLENIKENIDMIDVFYLIDGKSIDEQREIISYLTYKDKRIFLSANFDNIIRANNRVMNIDDESFIAVSKFEISPELNNIKRVMDFIVAIFIILITSPIMILTSLIIKLSSRGPILYKQTRITKDGKEFELYKFRSMTSDAEDSTGPVLAQASDPRVTKIGKYLRSLRIDELPQLFNVLIGDMSLVGPRPERPYFVKQYEDQNPSYYLRHKVRAGITGYAQVHGTYSTDFNNKLKFDLLYIKKYSLIMDVQIMFQTIKILFDKFSAQGIDNEFNNENIFNDIYVCDDYRTKG